MSKHLKVGADDGQRTSGKREERAMIDIGADLQRAFDEGYEKGKADRPQEWIPCSERLPKIGEVVLVTWEWGCKKYITIAYMVTIRGVTYWDSKLQHKYEPLNVLAWMPLPKPWKGADDE
jgi:hypothetical protein